MFNTAIKRVGPSFAIVAVILVLGSSIPLPGIVLDDTALQIRQFQVCSSGFHWIQCWVRYEIPNHHDLASATLGFAIVIFTGVWIWRRLTTHGTIKETEE